MDQTFGHTARLTARRDPNAALRERLPRSAAGPKATARKQAEWARAMGELRDVARARLDPAAASN